MASKLAIVVPALEQGGGVPGVADFLWRTAERSGAFEVTLVSLAQGARDPLSVRFTQPSSWSAGVGTERGEWEGRGFTRVGAFGSEVEFLRYQRRRALDQVLAACDVIQVVAGCPAWSWAVIGCGKPVSLQVATLARVERNQGRSRRLGPAAAWRGAMTLITSHLDNRALASVDAIQVENPWMLAHAGRVCAGHNVDLRYAPHGIDATEFRPLGQRIPSKDPYVLSVGRFSDERKNVMLLLEAYARLDAALKAEVRLVLAGSDPPPASFWARADALGLRERVGFIHRPSRDALAALYQRASVFVLPSHEEGLGIVLLEAMACGIPAVATRCGGPDGIITDGEDGFLVPVGDADRMADRMTALLRETGLSLQMGERARARIESAYTEGIAGEPFLEVWSRLAHRGPSLPSRVRSLGG
jgi:glycosyltransferase involved in cell wall biosynthesis